MKCRHHASATPATLQTYPNTASLDYSCYTDIEVDKPGVGLTVKVAGLRSHCLEFEPLLFVEITPGGLTACHPSEVGKMSTSLLATGTTASEVQPSSQQWCNQQAEAAYKIMKIMLIR